MYSIFTLLLPILSLVVAIMPQTVAAQPDSVGLCNNTYFPLRPGASWSYNTSYTRNATTRSVNNTRAVTSVVPQGDTAVANQTLTSASGTIPFNTTCTSYGLVQSIPEGMNIPALQLDKVSFQVVSQSGVLLPPASQIVPGATWSARYEFATSVSRMNRTFSGTTTAVIDSTAIGQEQVSVPAGTFNAMKVEQRITVTQTLTTARRPYQVTFSGVRLWYLAPNVGPVKMMPSPQQPLPGDATTELTTYVQP
jgi:hypothetical protein